MRFNGLGHLLDAFGRREYLSRDGYNQRGSLPETSDGQRGQYQQSDQAAWRNMNARPFTWQQDSTDPIEKRERTAAADGDCRDGEAPLARGAAEAGGPIGQS